MSIKFWLNILIIFHLHLPVFPPRLVPAQISCMKAVLLLPSRWIAKYSVQPNINPNLSQTSKPLYIPVFQKEEKKTKSLDVPAKCSPCKLMPKPQTIQSLHSDPVYQLHFFQVKALWKSQLGRPVLFFLVYMYSYGFMNKLDKKFSQFWQAVNRVNPCCCMFGCSSFEWSCVCVAV